VEIIMGLAWGAALFLAAALMLLLLAAVIAWTGIGLAAL
jgi:hypothetical protein